MTAGKPKDITVAHVSVSNPITVPSGALYVAAVLSEAGYRVDFKDLTAGSYLELDPERLVAGLSDSADIVGIGCMSDTLPFVIAAARKIKAQAPEKKILLGGPGPSGVGAALLEAFPFIDVIAVGEAEETVLEIAEALAAGTASRRDRSDRGGIRLGEVKGICLADGGRPVTTPPRERIRNLDNLPYPLYEAIEVERYPMVNIVFSRGCPYRCTFCDVAPMWQRKNFRRSVGSVVEEIRLLHSKYGKIHFEFTDETFILSEDKVLDLCDRLKREGLDIKWSCTGRVNLVNDTLLREMAAAGCQAMFFGIESGSDRVLERVNKEFTVSEAVEAIHLTLKYMRPATSFIWGFPFETKQDLTETLLLATYLSQIGVDCRLNRLAPFPLMPLFAEYGGDIEWVEPNGSRPGREAFNMAGYPAEVADLVRRFPKIFPSFYRFPTEGFEWKRRAVDSLGRYWMETGWGEEA